MIDLGTPPLWAPPKPAIIRASRIEKAPLPIAVTVPGTVPVVGNQGGTAINILRRLNLTSNLVLCLDATDAASYPGSGQTWSDMSGQGNDFYLGAGNTATTDDPTFNSTPPKNFSCDGGDYFTLTVANPTWVKNVSKDNAAVTLGIWANIATSMAFFGDQVTNDNSVGFGWRASSTTQAFRVGDGSAQPLAVTSATTVGPLASTNAFYAVVINEAAGTGFFLRNLVTDSFTSTYSSPSASDAGTALQIGARGANRTPTATGSVFYVIVAWSAALSGTQLFSFYQATRTLFGI